MDGRQSLIVLLALASVPWAASALQSSDVAPRDPTYVTECPGGAGYTVGPTDKIARTPLEHLSELDIPPELGYGDKLVEIDDDGEGWHGWFLFKRPHDHPESMAWYRLTLGCWPYSGGHFQL